MVFMLDDRLSIRAYIVGLVTVNGHSACQHPGLVKESVHILTTVSYQYIIQPAIQSFAFSFSHA